jgi:hypothetical protein
VRPSVSYWLVPELGLDRERPLRCAHVDQIADPISAADEIVILGRAPVDGDVLVGRGLVEPSGQQPIVFGVAESGEEDRGHGAVGFSEDRFVDLNLVGVVDLVVVGFEPGTVDVVVVAGDGPVRVEFPGLEHNATAVVADREVDPDTPRGVG